MNGIAIKSTIMVLVLGLIFSAFTGCGSDNGVDSELETETLGQAPPLPPDSSLTIDISAFGGGKMAPEVKIPGKNFRNASVRVLLIDTAVVAVLAAPVTVFKAAKTTIPVSQGGGSWLWSFTTTVFGNTYEANLTGTISGLNVLWSMRVSSSSPNLPLDDFEWYTGETNLSNTSGFWRFFDFRAPDEKNEIGTIEWTTNPSVIDFQPDHKSEIEFSNTDPESPNFEDRLNYSVEGTTASISFYDASEDINADITWDLVTIAGSLKVPNYNNGERACWDENKQDIVCP
jgi:hypothetical protein